MTSDPVAPAGMDSFSHLRIVRSGGFRGTHAELVVDHKLQAVVDSSTHPAPQHFQIDAADAESLVHAAVAAARAPGRTADMRLYDAFH